MKRIVNLLSGALLGMAVASCGGGGSTLAEGGIGGTGISSGSISAFSSIVVNGTKFDVDAAQITVNGSPAMQSALDIGYVVRVDGDLDDGVAETVRFDANLIGEVDSAPQPDGPNEWTLEVMQQTVRVTGTTVIKGAETIDDVMLSHDVLVSGFPVLDESASDDVVATHLEVLTSALPVDQVTGRVSSTAPVGGFLIGDLKVISTASVDKDDFVLVRGRYDMSVPEFNADSVKELEDLASPGMEIELEGIVDNFTSEKIFTVSGVPVDASGATVVDEAGEPATVQPGAEVEVEGAFDANGTTLVADRIEVELEDNVEIVARVSADPGANGPIQLLYNGVQAVSVAVTDKTQLRDKSDMPVANFSVADLVVGDWIELEGFEDGSGDVTALEIERFTPASSEEVVVEGLVDSVAPMSDILTILGLDFDTSGADFEDFNEMTITISDIGQGDVVEVSWTDNTPTDPVSSIAQPQPVEEVELEDEEN